jgi:hypothetical protein
VIDTDAWLCYYVGEPEVGSLQYCGRETGIHKVARVVVCRPKLRLVYPRGDWPNVFKLFPRYWYVI